MRRPGSGAGAAGPRSRRWPCCVLDLALAGVENNPDTPWVVAALALAIAFASATQDIAIDAYAVDVLQPDEQGVAVGARVAAVPRGHVRGRRPQHHAGGRASPGRW